MLITSRRKGYNTSSHLNPKRLKRSLCSTRSTSKSDSLSSAWSFGRASFIPDATSETTWTIWYPLAVAYARKPSRWDASAALCSLEDALAYYKGAPLSQQPRRVPKLHIKPGGGDKDPPSIGFDVEDFARIYPPAQGPWIDAKPFGRHRDFDSRMLSHRKQRSTKGQRNEGLLAMQVPATVVRPWPPAHERPPRPSHGCAQRIAQPTPACRGLGPLHSGQ